MRFEKSWQRIIPEMVATAIENSRATFLRTGASTLGTASCYFKGVTVETFSGIDKIMLKNGVDYGGKYLNWDKTTIYKIIIMADHRYDKTNMTYPYMWMLIPVTE